MRAWQFQCRLGSWTGSAPESLTRASAWSRPLSFVS
jgi:hypothetical protein